MIAVITGGSKGIGLAIAKKFFSEGYDVLTCSRNKGDLEQAANFFDGRGGGSFSYKVADLSQEEEAKAFAAWVLEKGTPHILVNNAGKYLPGDCLNEPDGNLQAMLATNLFSAYWLTRALLPTMIEKKSGHIFNICSIASLHAYPGGGGYSVSKFALHGFNKNLRQELIPHRIKVTGVYPGAVLTDSWEGFDNTGSRIMEAGDIAEMVFAASALSVAACVEEILLRPLQGDL